MFINALGGIVKNEWDQNLDLPGFDERLFTLSSAYGIDIFCSNTLDMYEETSFFFRLSLPENTC